MTAPSPLRFERRQMVRATVMVVCDLLALTVAFLLAGLLAMVVSEAVLDRPYTALSETIAPRALQVVTFGIVVLGWLLLHNHYSQRIPPWMESRGIVLACLLAMLGDGFLQFALKEPFSRLWLVFTWMLAALLLLLARSFGRALLERMAVFHVNVLIVGRPPQSGRAADALADNPALGYRVAAMATPDQAFAGDNPSWQGLLHRHGAEMVILAMTDVDMQAHGHRVRDLTLERIPFLMLRDLAGLPVAAMEVQHLMGCEAMVLSNESGLGTRLGRAMKFSFDHVVAVVLAVALSPLLLLIALALKAGGGPVLFVHWRIGRNGRPFPCFKFRTMTPNADARLQQLLAGDAEARREWNETRKLKDDPRVTRLGQWLRRTSLDELPQLLNVLRGEMSLVGPRPIVAEELPLYGGDQPFYTFVRPGITGLWQVSGRNDVDMSRRVALDRWYAANWSLWLDLVLLARTVPVVLRRRGAY